jgi:hypothetical protein
MDVGWTYYANPRVEDPSGRRKGIPRMSEAKVGESKESTGDALGSRRPPSRSTPTEETEQIVLTLSPKGEVLKVEKIEKSGQRHELSDEEFAALAGEDEREDLEAAFEEAYAAGVSDALGDEDEDEDEEEEEIALRQLILGRAVGRQLLRRGLRRLILRRALRRQLLGERPRDNGKAGRRGRAR